MKKILRILLLFALLSTSSGFAEEAPDFFLRGILDLDQNRAFSLTNESGESSGWIKIGQSFNGYKLTEIQQKTMQVMMPAIMESSQKMQTKMIEYMQNKRAAETEATE
jgi:hypothetical protein